MSLLANQNSPYLRSFVKRTVDLLVAGSICVPAMVVMTVLFVLVWACDGWPVILLQERVGRGGRVFRMPKFRTMTSVPRASDRTVTRLGSILRRHRLDELPQVFSVLLGQMSLVGPRPELVEIAAQHDGRQSLRLAAWPGMTGLWQIHGSRRLRIDQQIGFDLLYLRKASLRLDMAILVGTIRFVCRPAVWQI